MTVEVFHAVLAAPLLHGMRMPLLVVTAVVLGVLVTLLAMRSARRPSRKQAAPMTKPRLVRDDDGD